MKKEIKNRWFIAVGHGWGVIDEQYTKEEAEEMRVHKANWERAPAVKILAVDFFKLKDREIENHWAYKMIKEVGKIRPMTKGEKKIASELDKHFKKTNQRTLNPREGIK